MSSGIGRRIEIAIKASGLSKAEVARRLKATPQAVNGWIKTGTITKDNLAALARLVGRTVESILNDDWVEMKTNNPNSQDFIKILSDEEYDRLSFKDTYGTTIEESAPVYMKQKSIVRRLPTAIRKRIIHSLDLQSAIGSEPEELKTLILMLIQLYLPKEQTAKTKVEAIIELLK